MTRRGNGEGMKPVQRKDGLWQCALRTDDGHRKFVYGKTRKEAQAKLSALRRAQEEGRLVTGPAKKVGAYLDEWLEDHVLLTVQATTYDSYKCDVERLRPYIGHIRLDALRYEHIQNAYAELLKRLSATSVHRVHRGLKTALRHAVLLGLLWNNPIDRVTPPKPPRKEMRPLTPDEVNVFLESTRDDPLHALWVLLVTTGMRVGEATALHWEDLELKAATLQIQDTVKRVKGKGLVIGDVKTAHSRRRIILAGSTVDALRIHQEQQRLARKVAGDKWSDRGLVFCTAMGGPLDAGSVSHTKDRALTAAGLPHVRTHDLRHTAATYLMSQGVHPKVVQDLLGHSSITLTMNTYSHVLPSLHQEVADHMDRLASRRSTDLS